MIDSFIVFKWVRPGYRSKFTARTVNIAKRMVRRCLPGDYRFICITDDPSNLDPDIEAIPLWSDHRDLSNPSWKDAPNCYPRLKVFSEEFRKIAGERFMCGDLDAVYTRSLRPLVERTEDLVMWRTNHPHVPYCAALMLMTAGAFPEVWDDFDPVESPRLSTEAGFRGSDQAWINCRLRGRIAGWTNADGVYGYREHGRKAPLTTLPGNARVVTFCGKPDPWEPEAQNKARWIRRFYV